MKNINRQDLKRFDLEAFIHILFYRIAVIYAIFNSIVIILNVLGIISDLGLKISLAILWVLLTPSFYELNKGMVMAITRGLAFGHIAENLREILSRKYGGNLYLYKSLVYISLAIWILGFILFIAYG